MTRIAVTSRSFSRNAELREALLAKYPDVTFNDQGQSLRGNALIEFLQGHDKAITALEPIDDNMLRALPDLKVIAKYGVGIDMIDLRALSRHQVALGWTGGVNKRSVSELVISFAIALMRYVPKAHREVLSGTWRQHVGQQLTGKTIGIIGCGHVGKDLVSLLKPFQCNVLAHDIRDYPEFFESHDVDAVSLVSLLSQSDVVSIHTPLDDSTRGLISGKEIALMKPGSFLINAARGGIVDEAALRDALDGGRLGGAAFDVFHTEPPTDQKLLELPNFLVTPHIGGSSAEAIRAMGLSAIAGLDHATIPDASGALPETEVG